MINKQVSDTFGFSIENHVLSRMLNDIKNSFYLMLNKNPQVKRRR